MQILERFARTARHKTEPAREPLEDSIEDYRSKLRAMRPIAYGLLAFWLALYVGIAFWAGWLP